MGWYWRWIVLSKGKRTSVLRFLFSKWLFDELSRIELMLLLDLPEFLSNDFMSACFRIANMLGKKELRRRLKRIESILPRELIFDRKKYIGLKSLRVSIRIERLESPEYPKFTGWRRHQRVAKGSPEGSPKWDDLVLRTEIDVLTSPLDWFVLLISVGESTRITLGGMYLSPMSLKKGETEIT
jgi:hypothetical protein